MQRHSLTTPPQSRHHAACSASHQPKPSPSTSNISQQLYSQRNPTTSLLATLHAYAFVRQVQQEILQDRALNAATQLDNALKVGTLRSSASHQPKPSLLPAIYLSNYTVSVTLTTSLFSHAAAYAFVRQGRSRRTCRIAPLNAATQLDNASK
jgi:hypothetical protein